MEEDDILDDVFESDNNSNINVEYAGFWIRAGASIIDGLIFVPFVILEIYNKTSLHSLSLLILTTVLMLIYKPYLEYIRGATIGKSAMNIKVVQEDLTLISLNQAILRFMPWFISSFIAFMVSLEIYTGDLVAENFMEIGHKFPKEASWTNFNGLYSLVFIVIVVFVAFDQKKQGLHDKIADTYCIISKR